MSAAPASARDRRVRVPGLAIATLVLLVLAVCSLAPAIGTALTQQQRIAATAATIAAQRAELTRLDADLARENDPAALTAQAGSRLFFVLPGETTYRVVGTAPASAAPTRSRRAELATPDWKAALLRSLASAGAGG